MSKLKLLAVTVRAFLSFPAYQAAPTSRQKGQPPPTSPAVNFKIEHVSPFGPQAS